MALATELTVAGVGYTAAATTGWEGGIYVAAPNLVLQSGPLALIISVKRHLGGQAKPGRLALRDQSARPVTCFQPDLRSCPSERVVNSSTSLIAQFDRFPRILPAL